MSSAVLNSAIKNTPYNALKRGKNREWYSRLSAGAKQNKITGSMEIRARTNSTKQGCLQEAGHDTILQSALTQHASGPSTRMTRGALRGVHNPFDSGLWEPDDPMHGVEKMIWIMKIRMMVMLTCMRMLRPGFLTKERLATVKGTGVYRFKAHGQISHRLDQLAPVDAPALNLDNGAENVIHHDQEVGEVSLREYYCYDLQIRPGKFNVVHLGGRQFQQWVVDMYVKVESMRLDWVS
ncbi:hypothetical protein U9M48_019821 [Paspalum notatum var. saurae]